MNKLKRGDILFWTSKKSYGRGRRYYEQGRVKELRVEQFDNGMIMLQGRVKGSRHSLYEQDITISFEDDVVMDLNGYCSCPVALNCKHVVAVCLEYATTQGKLPLKSSSLDWLEDFIQSGTEADLEECLPGSEFIAYVLDFGNPGHFDLSARFLIVRSLKSGGLSRGRRTQVYNFIGMRPAYARPVDQEIARLLNAERAVNMWAGSYEQELKGELGFLALSKMMQTGRCFWQNTANPLGFGEPRKLQFDWHRQKNGDRRLSMHVQPEGHLLNFQPPLYLDLETKTLGMLEGAEFTPQQWRMLLESPTVPERECNEFTRQLLNRLPAYPLPPPVEMETVEIEGVSPVPCLFLFAEPDSAGGERMHMMRLRCAYDNHEIPLLPFSPMRNLVTENRITRIQRDLDRENAAVKILLDAGFQAVPDNGNGDLVFASPRETDPMSCNLRWQHFLDEMLPGLEEQGWKVEFDTGFRLRFLQVDDWDVEIESGNDWFELRFDLDIEGQKLPLLPLVAEVLNRHEPDELPETLILPLPEEAMGEGQYLRLPAERIRPVCQLLYELYDAETLNSDGSMRMGRFDAARLAELEESCSSEIHWRGGEAMRELGRRLRDFQGIEKVPPPSGLKTRLRDYQGQGLNWLQFLREYQFNGVLADDMGLGKTVQTLAHLLIEKESGRMDKPCLVIAPTSLMSNWFREAEQFAPALRVLVLQGPDRRQHFSRIAEHDLVLSTYPLLPRDHEVLLAQEYHYLILDEAQVIKNPRARAARLAREIRTRHRLCLTGTPMENHLGELWALFDFLMPGFLGDVKSFKQHFRTPIEKHGDTERRQRLVRRVAPFLLRRTKAEVADELPPKTEMIRSVSLDSKQAVLYESVRLSMEKKVRDAIGKKGLARSHITILDALLKLRQICCDPQLLSLPQAKKVKTSAKLEMLMEMLPELLEEGRRILLFSQFTRMLGIIEKRLRDMDIDYAKLTGQTRKRDAAIQRFRNGEANVFLISLKAGGVGLNLTEADTVIHYDPWWNPAVENQATDRAHRIGQDKPVFVYKLITENTLEEKILAMQARKQALAESVYRGGKQGGELKLDMEDLQELFAPLAD